MDLKLELILLPVSDVDRAKAFYADNAGFNVDVDHSAGEDFRIVQLTPPGSACSVTIMKNNQTPGHDPERRDYGTFAAFSDPDGNGWVLQEVRNTNERS